MKGLPRIPSPTEIQSAILRLGTSAKGAVGLISLAVYSQYARLDPRLAETWIEHIARNWREISPVLLREKILRQPWPSAAALLLDQVEHTGLLESAERKLFKKWKATVSTDIKPALGELFLIGVTAFASKRLDLDSAQALKAYQNWGYLALSRDDAFFLNKARQKHESNNRSLLSRPERVKVLEQLIHTTPRITAITYRSALGFLVSKRVAELDLQSHPGLKKRGETKGRFYIKK